MTPAGIVPRLQARSPSSAPSTPATTSTTAASRWSHLDDAAKLFRVDGPTGVQLRLKDLTARRGWRAELANSLGPRSSCATGRSTNRNWFAAVQVEKRLMFIILTLIIAVAAFNLVSTLVMTVTDKRADIAILRTLGATPRSIMGIFMVQGAASGVIGTLAGVLLGLLRRLQHRRHRAGDRARCCTSASCRAAST